MSNFVNFQIELKPENATLIDQVSKLLIPGYSSASTSTETTSKPAKETSTIESSSGLAMADVKKVMQEAKKEHDLDFVKECLTSAGATGGSVPKMLSSIDPSNYEQLVELLKAGPVSTGDEPDEDEDWDDEEEPEVTVDDVKLALKAFKKENGMADTKAIMKKYGCNTLTDVDSLDNSKLSDMFGELV